MDNTLFETIQTLRYQAERLEQEAGELRQALAHVAAGLTPPSFVVAQYVIDGKTYEVTQAEVDAIKQTLTKPRADETFCELVASKKLAADLRKLPLEEQNRYFFETVEAIRTAAIEDGTALETEAEAVALNI